MLSYRPLGAGGGWGRGRQRFAVGERDVAERGPAVADVGFAVGVQRQDPGVPLVAVSLVGDLEDGQEAVVQERVVAAGR